MIQGNYIADIEIRKSDEIAGICFSDSDRKNLTYLFPIDKGIIASKV